MPETESSRWLSPSNWVPIVGRWLTDDQLDYQPPIPAADGHPFGILLSNVQFTEGAVHVRVQPEHHTDTAARILFGYVGQDAPYYTVGLGGYERAFVLSEYVPTMGWRGLAVTGSAANLIANRTYNIEVHVTGQVVKLLVDGVQVLQHTLGNPINEGQLGLFAWGRAPIRFLEPKYKQEAGAAFVVMQFSEPYQHLYKEVIVPVCSRYGLRAYHVGEVFGPGLILKDIIQGIQEAKVVIAEITPVNQNVFYELGYAHAMNKPTILLAERGKQLPFDITGHRCVFYDNTIAGKSLVEESLGKHLAAVFGEHALAGDAGVA